MSGEVVLSTTILKLFAIPNLNNNQNMKTMQSLNLYKNYKLIGLVFS